MLQPGLLPFGERSFTRYHDHPTWEHQMAFTFEVEFSGLCLFLIHSDTTRIGVLMPDGRLKRDKTIGYYRDGQVAVPHVCYVRYNLRDVDSSMPTVALDSPAFEVVHHFNFEEVD